MKFFLARLFLRYNHLIVSLIEFQPLLLKRCTQLVGLGQGDPQAQARLENLQEYVHLGPLGRAIQDSNKGYRAVVLIDEVDKGSSDFANNLLYELDQFILDIKETGKLLGCPKEQKPIVIITSNGYRPLPEALLRRCLYFEIAFPTTKQLERIVQSRFTTDGVTKETQERFSKVINRFQQVREAVDNSAHRKPSTSELIDFIKVLPHSSEKYQSVLDQLPDPYLGILLKTSAARKHFRAWQEKQKKQ